ncbi:unnamed protein product [Echinostoma caproni]|uniref:Uncharacterized protein n=1 Tax=Echinostoma caproni TaxID=27848 RepID=A0A183BCS7_9TREM|nr:unnamed protein product [Echinostoma caproni]
MPPALRDHTAALLSKWRQDAPAPCISSIAEQSATSSTQSPADITDSSADSQSNTAASLVNNAAAHDDGLDALPPTPPPNLLFRLYQNSDNGSRELLCNFLQTSSSLSPLAAPKRRRTGRRGTNR